MEGPLRTLPSTPTSHRHSSSSFHSSPFSSSPLSARHSPPHTVAHASTRRRGQYKQIASSPAVSRYSSSHSRSCSASLNPIRRMTSVGEVFLHSEEAPRKAVLRERLRARCRERAQQDREKKFLTKRQLSSDASSDGVDADMDCEDDADDEGVLNDELFSRIMQSVNRKQKHQYQLSYRFDVGSSFDPELEDVAGWERELKGDDMGPENVDEEELLAYAEEYQLAEDLLNLPEDDIFSLSDLDDVPEEVPFDWRTRPSQKPASGSKDVEMDCAS